jgi:5-methyltetrahydropteroyltriglutamate--homocysteine methyltransferase
MSLSDRHRMGGESVNALRADQVGSLLRPSGLLQARVDFSAGRLDRDGLRAEEDRAVLEALHRQRERGIDVLSDGEFRRSWFMAGLLAAVEGLVESEPVALPWRGGEAARPGQRAGVGVVVDRLRPRGRVAEEEARFLCQHAGGPFKVTLPSPLLLAQSAYRPGVSDRAYRSREELVADAGAILADEARRLADEGVPYVQVDAPGYSLWLDPALASRSREDGVDGRGLLRAAIAADNLVLDAARAGGALTAVHLCRGNDRGRWLAEGGYDPIAERLFRGLRCDRLLLEFDSPRAGGFQPLRFVPAGMVVVLGLVSTKTGELESRDDLLRRIDQASRIVPLEQLALSPQCGFASVMAGNPLTEDEQWRKLELVAELAREVWP